MKKFDKDLASLRNRVVEMGKLVHQTPVRRR